MSGSGISWAICKSAPRSRQIIAKFHYTDPTGPARTRTDFFAANLRWVRAGLRQSPCGSVRVHEGPVGSGRARVMEFSYKQPACYSLGWDRQTDGQTNGSRYRLMLPYGGGIITGQKQTDRAYTRPYGLTLSTMDAVT